MKPNAIWRIIWAWSFLLPNICSAAPPPTHFDPFPAGSATKYHFDLAKNFFSSPKVEASERSLLITRLERFQQLYGRAPQNPDSLLSALRTQDSLDLQVSRHDSYLDLLYNSDTRNEDAQTAVAELRSVSDKNFAAFDSVIASLPETLFTKMVKAQPALERYRFAIETARRRAAHPGAASWSQISGAQRFWATMNGTDFGFVETPAGSLSVAREYTAIASNPDRRVRREGYLRNEAGLARNQDVYADILVSTAKSLNAAARLRGYADYSAETYDDRFLDRTKVRAMLDSLAARAEINKRIERALIDHYRRSHKLDTVHRWDLTLPEPGMSIPRFTIKDATQTVVDATRPLGESYTRELTALLDPANGRLDIAPGPNRANRQGFSNGLVGFPSMFYQGEFQGYVDDVVTLVHESGHAVQNMLMTANGVLPRYAWGPAYFTESFAGFCELLVLEHLYETAPDRAHKIFYLQQLITQGTWMFRAGWESLMEQQLFDRVGTDSTLTADDIEALTQSTGSRFSVWLGPGSEWRLAWLQPTTYFVRPLYRVNYMYSKLLALLYIDLLHRDPAQFKKNYLALLSNGYDAPPDVLLQRFVGTRIDDPALLDGAVHVLDSWLKELETLYGS